MPEYRRNLRAGLGGLGNYRVRAIPSAPTMSVNIGASGAFDYLSDGLTIDGITVEPTILIHGKDISDLGVATTIGPDLVPYGGSFTFATGAIEQVECPYSGPDYTGAFLTNTGATTRGIWTAESNATANFGANDFVIEGLIRCGAFSGSPIPISKASSATPAAGQGWLVEYVPNGLDGRLRFRSNGSSIVTPQYSALPGMWSHFMVFYDAENKASIYIDGKPGTSELSLTGAVDADTPLSIGGFYNTSAVRGHIAIAFLSICQSPTWLNGATYGDYAEERFFKCFEKITTPSNSNLYTNIRRTSPLMRKDTGDIYQASTPSRSGPSLRTSTATQNLLPCAIINDTTGWDVTNATTSFAVSFGEGAILPGQTTQLRSNVVTSGGVSFSTNITGLNTLSNSALSFWANSGTCNNLKITINDDGTNSHTVWINTTAGTIINATAGVLATVNNDATWPRYGIVKPNTNTGSNVVIEMAIDGDTSLTFASASFVMNMWGLCLQNGDNPWTDVPLTLGVPDTNYQEYIEYSPVVAEHSSSIIASINIQDDAPSSYNIISHYDSVNTNTNVSISLDTNVLANISGSTYADLGGLDGGDNHDVSVSYIQDLNITSVDGVYTESPGPSSLPQGMNRIKLSSGARSIKLYPYITRG